MAGSSTSGLDQRGILDIRILPLLSAWNATEYRAPGTIVKLNIVFCRRAGQTVPAATGQPDRLAQRTRDQPHELGVVAGRLDVAVGDGDEHRGVGGDALALLIALDALGREHDVDDQRLGGVQQVTVEVADQLVVGEIDDGVMAGPDQALRVERRMGADELVGELAQPGHQRSRRGRQPAPPTPPAAVSATRGSRCSRPATGRFPSPGVASRPGSPGAIARRRCPHRGPDAWRSARRWSAG